MVESYQKSLPVLPKWQMFDILKYVNYRNYVKEDVLFGLNTKYRQMVEEDDPCFN